MKNLNNTYNAYTLVELLVVLITTALILSLGITIYFNIRQQYVQFNDQLEKQNNCLQLEDLLLSDISRSNTVIFDNASQKVTLHTLTDTLTYMFIENRVLRGNDTLYCKKIQWYKDKIVYLAQQKENTTN